jgi:hypothetical protein
MKKIYIFMILATMFVLKSNAQNLLVWDVFNDNAYGSTSFSGWWPLSWSFNGDWTDGCITSNSSRGIIIEDITATPRVASFREIYQNVDLGIGTFQLNDTTGVEYYASSTICPFGYKITCADGTVLLDTLLSADVAHDGTMLPHGPFTFTTTVNTHYKFAVQATRGDTYGYSALGIRNLNLIQLDGDPYDPAADQFTGINNILSKPCTAVVIGDKIVLNAEELILKASLISLNGSILYKASINQNRFEIAKPTLNGVYFVTIQTATQNKVVKLSVN